MRINKPRSAHSTTGRGFTLIEVVLALMILGASLVVLLGLQSSIINRTVRDANKAKAILLARYVLSAIETSTTPPNTMDFEGTMEDVLDRVNISASNAPELGPEASKEYRGHLTITDFGIPQVDDKIMRKVVLVVNWSESSTDSISVTYFIPSS